jgi:hypothetical protein
MFASVKSFVTVVAAALGLAAGIAAAPAAAQNINARAAYGSVSLSAGFLPDPYVVNVRAGGDWYFTTTRTCQRGGWFANAPDFRLNYRAGGYQLSVYAVGPGDTMLLVNDPFGGWHCNDDYSGLHPAIVFNNPASGRYEIWVGTYNRARVRNTRLHISELGPFSR